MTTELREKSESIDLHNDSKTAAPVMAHEAACKRLNNILLFSLDEDDVRLSFQEFIQEFPQFANLARSIFNDKVGGLI